MAAVRRLLGHVAQHPCRLLEHVALAMALTGLMMATWRPHDCSRCDVALPRVGDVEFLQAEGVQEAPLPTMGDRSLSRMGQITEHHDMRGDIYRFSMGDGVVVNLMRTVGGSMRSGDMHNCTQFDVLLRGRTRLFLMDLHTGKEAVHEYGGEHDYIAIPPRVPHLFEFVEDSFVLEWWACEFHAWYYKPYRDIIQKAFEKGNKREAEGGA